MTDDGASTPKRPARPTRPAPRRPKPKPAPEVTTAARRAVPHPVVQPVEARVAESSPATPVAAEPIIASSATSSERVGDIKPANPEAVVVDNPEEDTSAGFILFTAMPSWLASTIVHVIVLLLLAILSQPTVLRPEIKRELIISNLDEESRVESLEDFDPSDELEMNEVEIDTTLPPMDSETPIEEFDVAPAQDLSAAAAKVELDPAGILSAPDTMLKQSVAAVSGNAFSGRGQASRKRMVREGGGNAGSEAAVMMALEWFAQHQLSDGGWDLNHRRGPCQGRCGNPGEREPARFGATGLALLPFLGAGNTHQEGPYKEVVARGLEFLVRNIKVEGPSGRLVDEGNYYSHGLCTIALCEAFAMTKDKSLMPHAQLLVNEIVIAQDRLGGGWRYDRGAAGDTSVLGWLVMGLKSADMAYLQIEPHTLQGAKVFLDSVQHDGGARYRYMFLNKKGQPGKRTTISMSAVGLLMRMYMGWERDDEVLQDGVARIAKAGPSSSNMYYNYYATQVMHHFHNPTDPAWEKWNKKMRDFLVEAQQREGHAAGSWYFDGDAGHAKAGGRLYATSLATMILEVYYRHMPLYQSEASEDDFQL